MIEFMDKGAAFFLANFRLFHLIVFPLVSLWSLSVAISQYSNRGKYESYGHSWKGYFLMSIGQALFVCSLLISLNKLFTIMLNTLILISFVLGLFIIFTHRRHDEKIPKATEN